MGLFLEQKETHDLEAAVVAAVPVHERTNAVSSTGRATVTGEIASGIEKAILRGTIRIGMDAITTAVGTVAIMGETTAGDELAEQHQIVVPLQMMIEMATGGTGALLGMRRTEGAPLLLAPLVQSRITTRIRLRRTRRLPQRACLRSPRSVGRRSSPSTGPPRRLSMQCKQLWRPLPRKSLQAVQACLRLPSKQRCRHRRCPLMAQL